MTAITVDQLKELRDKRIAEYRKLLAAEPRRGRPEWKLQLARLGGRCNELEELVAMLEVL